MAIQKTNDWLRINKNRKCEIYYFIIKTNKKPDITKLNLTDSEIQNNFNINFYKLYETINVLKGHLDKDERNYGITQI